MTTTTDLGMFKVTQSVLNELRQMIRQVAMGHT